MKKKETRGLSSSSLMRIVPAVALYLTVTPLIVTVLVVSERSSFGSFSLAPAVASSFFSAFSWADFFPSGARGGVGRLGARLKKGRRGQPHAQHKSDFHLASLSFSSLRSNATTSS